MQSARTGINKAILFCIFVGAFFAPYSPFASSAPPRDSARAATYRVVSAVGIEEVPSWFPVNFSLITLKGKHFVAYYDAAHEMKVAQCAIGKTSWTRSALPSRIGWDSHNYVTLAADSAGHLHLSGNMHGHPLVYFRTTEPGNIHSLVATGMVGRDEGHCTYPLFLTESDGKLLFLYRDGGSGNGSNIVNRYDLASQTWSRFLEKPLFDGENQRNSYPLGPLQGVDGQFHMVWVWRDTPDCATNHHLSYARSRDLKHWETAAGEPLELPLRLGQSETYIDPIPSGGGIINGCQKLLFDGLGRPVVVYHKSDNNGNMQIYVARFEKDRWNVQPVTAWDKPIPFGGYGSMPFIGIKIEDFRSLGDHHFVVGYRHRDYGKGEIVLGQETLSPTDKHPPLENEFPDEITHPASDWPGMHVRTVEGSLSSDDADTRYLLRWETLETNQDRPRDPPLPPASRLELITLQRQ